MALRQMGIARMGNYRPKHDAVQRGGKTGRPKLLHNGTGHGLTGGGGLNAKGTGGGIKVNSAMKPMQRQLRKSKYQSNKFNAMKINEREKNRAKRAEAKTQTQAGPTMNPHPVGSFMYGNNQWGSINKLGKVDWTATKPMHGKPIIAFQQALPWLQRNPHMRTVAQQFLSKRQAPPAWYIDPIYAREKASADLLKNQELADLSHRETQSSFDFTNAMDDMARDYDQSVGETNLRMSSGNMAGSGISAAALGEIAEALNLAKTQNIRQMEIENTDIERLRKQADTAHGVSTNSSSEMAKERWKATHQGQKPPKSKANTSWTENGIRYRANSHGVPMTANQGKPKFKSFKSFKDAKGNIVRK